MTKNLLFLLFVLPGVLIAEPVIDSEQEQFTYQILARNLERPWGMTFLPNGDILVTEKVGRLRLINRHGELHPSPIQGLPKIRPYGQGGLLDVALHPEFEQNRWIYFSFAERTGRGAGTAVARGQLQGHRLDNVEIIFRLKPKTASSYHFGSRLVFDNQGYLFITLGDRGKRSRAQDLNDHAGSLIRLHDDGRVPDDNPFVGQDDKMPEIFSYGHRNIQGAALHPATGEIWLHEHGPQGGDELNIPKAGINHGWPIITYGRNYVSGTRIGEGTHKAGMAQPIHYWVPSIAPSGMAFYNGDQFPNWKGSLFIGSLKFRLLARLDLDGNRVISEERLLKGEFGRIRDVRQGPDGFIYLLTDDSDGMLVRLLPTDRQ